jgi:MFS family permease
VSGSSTRIDILRDPILRPFAIGRIASALGASIVTFTAGYQLYAITGKAWALGLSGLFELAPVLFLMVPAGMAADRYPRRNVAMLAYAMLALASVGLAFTSYLGLPIAFIYACLTLAGAARAFASPSVGTIIPQLVKPEQMTSAMAWLSSSYEIASITGPGLAGFLTAASPTLAYAVAAIGQVVFIGCLTLIPARPPGAHIERSLKDVFEGFYFIRKNPLFLSAITLDMFAVLFGGAVALLPVFAKDILHVGPVALGWLRAAPSFGALTMALAVQRMRPWARPGVMLLCAVAGFGIATIGFGLSTNFALSMLCLYATGVFDEISVVIRSTIQQTITPDRLRGRVSAVNYVFVGFSNELGAFESGAAATLFGPVLATVGGGVVSILIAGVVMLVWRDLPKVGPLHTLQPIDTAVSELARVNA